MSRYVTEAQLDKIIEKATKRTIMAFLSEADKPKSSGKSKDKPKAEQFAGEAELIEALVEHYDDFDGSELAEASRERTATKKNPKGRCGYYALVMTWAIQNKNTEAKAWCEAKGSSKNLQKWFRKATK